MRFDFSRLLVLLTASAALLCAQPETATLRGTVTDAKGVPVEDVTVAITEPENVVPARRAVTRAGGVYEAAFLKPGFYRVSIDEVFVAEAVLLEPGQARRLDIQLPPEDSDTIITVHDTPSPLHAESGAVTHPVDYELKWNDAPVAENHPSALPLLATAPAVQGNGRGLVISGISSRQQQTWAVDGVPHDTTDQTGNPAFFGVAQVTIAGAGVESARPVHFNMVSKRAGDGIHGTFYYKRATSKFDARSFFEPTRPDYKLSEAFGEMSFPLIYGRTWIHGGGMYQKNPYAQTMFSDVPTEAMRSWDFSAFLDPQTAPGGRVVTIRDPRNNLPFPGNVIPSNRINSVSLKYLGYYPSPNTGAEGAYTQNYSWLHPFGPDMYVGNWPFARVDHRMWRGNHLYVRWMQNQTASVAPGRVSEQFASTHSPRYRGLVFADVQEVSPSLVNHFKYARTEIRVKQGQSEDSVDPMSGDQVVSTVGLQGVNPQGYSGMGFPAVAISGLTPLSMTYAGGQDKDVAHDDGIVSIEDGITWSHGRHTVKAGVQHLRLSWRDGTVPQTAWGAFTFSGAFTGLAFADFALGIPATSTRQAVRTNRLIRQNQTGAYLADTFRITPRVTLDFGVRWDYYGSPYYDDGYMANWDPATATLIVAPGTFTSVSPYYPGSVSVAVGEVVPEAKTTNIRPRLGGAFRLTGNLVLRAGYGEFTENPGYGLLGRVSAGNPFDLTETYTNEMVGTSASLTFPRPFPANPSSSLLPGQSVTAFPMSTDEGVIRQYHAGLDATTWGWHLRAAFIGARGKGMNYLLDTNKPPAGATPFTTARRPVPQFVSTYEVRTDGEWHYDSAVLQVQRRTGPVFFNSSFTLANNVSNYANTIDPYNVTNQWTRDGANRRLYSVTSALWQLPFGRNRRLLSKAGPLLNLAVSDWSVQTIATFASGQYYSPWFTGPDPANASSGFVTQLPDCVGDPDSGARTKSRWFNPAAFAVPGPQAGRYGTCGMNTLEGYPIHVGHVSVAKSIPFGEHVRLVFTTQVSNVTNTPHFTAPNSNISLPDAGMFTAASLADIAGAERLGYRQIHFKLRLQW